jgi:uncharacterized membrane protein
MYRSSSPDRVDSSKEVTLKIAHFVWRYSFFIGCLALGLIGLLVTLIFWGENLHIGFLSGIAIGWPIAAAVASELPLPDGYLNRNN